MDMKQLSEARIRSVGDIWWDWELKFKNHKIRHFINTGRGDLLEIVNTEKYLIPVETDDYHEVWRLTKMVTGDFSKESSGSEWRINFEDGRPIHVEGGVVASARTESVHSHNHHAPLS